MKNSIRMTAAVSAILVCLLLASCGTPAQPTPAASGAPVPIAPVTTCATKECFIAASNECKEISVKLDQPAGTFNYVAKDCVLKKTLVSLKPEESQEMKTALQGKSMTCKFEKGKFDTRWIDSLIFGSENCEGELKDNLGRLLAFT